MQSNMVAVQQVGVLTLQPFGSAGYTGSLGVGFSNQPFKNLSLIIRPVDDPSAYQVDVYHDSELLETHAYVAGRTIAEMAYPDFVFPANYGTIAIPQYNKTGDAPIGTPITIRVYNNEAAVRVFEIYANFEVYENCRFLKLTPTI